MSKEICNYIDCTGCSACSNICPKGCINFVENQEGFQYPEINTDVCVNCNLCTRVCPTNHDTHKENSTFYMCWNKDVDVLLNSSSGGAFTAIAKAIFERGGIVFGAYQDFKERKVFHIEVDSFEALDKIRLSKYCQSSIGQIYQHICNLLVNLTPVLFCGTACQVAGLFGYLKQTPAKDKIDFLYTVDILCHGVASQKVVNAYLKKNFKKK